LVAKRIISWRVSLSFINPRFFAVGSTGAAQRFASS